MHKGSRTLWRLLLVLIGVGTLSGLVAVVKRAAVEARNKDVEIGLEYDEVARLAQVSQRPLGETLAQFKNQGVTSLIFNEDLLATLEQTGQAQAARVTQSDGSYVTYVRLDSAATLARIHDALAGARPCDPGVYGRLQTDDGQHRLCRAGRLGYAVHSRSECERQRACHAR